MQQKIFYCDQLYSNEDLSQKKYENSPINKSDYRYIDYKASKTKSRTVVSSNIRNKQKKQKDKPKVSFLNRLIAFAFVLFIGGVVIPFSFRNIVQNIYINPYTRKNIQVDYDKLINPTLSYISNDTFMGRNYLKAAETKNPEMQPIFLSHEISDLSRQIKYLANSYPAIKASVFVWDFETTNWAGINTDEIYSAASIIKIPVLIELFKSIEHKQLSLYDKMVLKDYYRAEGSGALQYKKEDTEYSLDTLARVMIQDSDNSATNMLIAALGGKVDINRAIRNWGLKKTNVQNMLPDLSGTNYTTAKDLATMLFNIDNPSFLSLSSREKIVDYMSNVKNTRLLKAGLPPNATLIHKTGDIGKMLGDAGIVFAPNGKKYIIVVLANRPYNSPLGKEFIVNTSSLVYNYMVNGF